MPKASPCPACNTDQNLRFRFREYEDHTVDWVVACDGCGRTSSPGNSKAAAGNNWNKEIKTRFDHRHTS